MRIEESVFTIDDVLVPECIFLIEFKKITYFRIFALYIYVYLCTILYYCLFVNENIVIYDKRLFSFFPFCVIGDNEIKRLANVSEFKLRLWIVAKVCFI